MAYDPTPALTEDDVADVLYEQWVDDQIEAEREEEYRQIVWESVHPSFLESERPMEYVVWISNGDQSQNAYGTGYRFADHDEALVGARVTSDRIPAGWSVTIYPAEPDGPVNWDAPEVFTETA